MNRLVVAPQQFATKREAGRWLSSVQTDIGRGAWIDPEAGRIALAEFSYAGFAITPVCDDAPATTTRGTCATTSFRCSATSSSPVSPRAPYAGGIPGSSRLGG
jgi:hypothetical protein